MQVSRKMVLLGHFGVGKTSLIRRFVANSFSDNYRVSIGVHITKKVVHIGPNQEVSLIIWDLEGTDDIAMVRDNYLLGTHGLVYVFDVNRPSTFHNIQRDLEVIEKKLAKIPLLVVGNKMDLVVEDELSALLKSHSIAVDYLTSAKTGGMVDDLFLKMAALLYKDA